MLCQVISGEVWIGKVRSCYFR